MTTILAPIVERLKAAGPTRWEPIADRAGVARSLPRKLVYGDRANPTVGTIQPLIDFFAAVDRGEETIPEPEVKAEPAAAGIAAQAAEQGG